MPSLLWTCSLYSLKLGVQYDFRIFISKAALLNFAILNNICICITMAIFWHMNFLDVFSILKLNFTFYNFIERFVNRNKSNRRKDGRQRLLFETQTKKAIAVWGWQKRQMCVLLSNRRQDEKFNNGFADRSADEDLRKTAVPGSRFKSFIFYSLLLLCIVT